MSRLYIFQRISRAILLSQSRKIPYTTIQIRLVVASVEKAREMGMDWWTTNPDLRSQVGATATETELAELKERLARLESRSEGERAAVALSPVAQSSPQLA